MYLLLEWIVSLAKYRQLLNFVPSLVGKMKARQIYQSLSTLHILRAAAASHNGTPVADLDATREPILGRLFSHKSRCISGFFYSAAKPKFWRVASVVVATKFRARASCDGISRTKLLIERASGAAAETTRKEVIRDKPPAATKEQLLQGLERFHQQELITPVVCPAGVWAKRCRAQILCWCGTGAFNSAITANVFERVV